MHTPLAFGDGASMPSGDADMRRVSIPLANMHLRGALDVRIKRASELLIMHTSECGLGCDVLLSQLFMAWF